MAPSSRPLLLAAAAAAAALCVAPSAAAGALGPGDCTRTWDGGAATAAWSDAANWSGDTVPGPGDVACVTTPAAVTGATVTLGGLVVTGAASLTLGPGVTLTLTRPDASPVANLHVTGGTLGGPSPVEVAGAFTLAGTLAAPAPGATLTLTGGANGAVTAPSALQGRRVEVGPGAVLTQAHALTATGTGPHPAVRNAGTWVVATPGAALTGGGAANASGGVLRVSAGAGVATLPALANDGIVDVVSGTLGVPAAAAGAAALVLDDPSATHTGSGTVRPRLILRSGTLSPTAPDGGAVATLAVTGAPGELTVSGGGLTVDIGHGTSDRVTATGACALGGVLRPRLLPGYVPVHGDAFELVFCAGGRTGQFAAVDTSGLAGAGLAVAYSGTGVVARVQAPPVPVTAPSVVGAAMAGSPLLCATGAWTGTPGPALAVQWLRDGTPVPGATATTYTPAAGDAGHEIRCRVDATNAHSTASATSAPVTPAALPLPRVTGEPPAVLGAAGVGLTLTCLRGDWTGAREFAVQWTRGGVPVPGAVNDLYEVTAADAGLAVRCRVTATNAAGAAYAESAPVVAAAAASASAGSYRLVSGSVSALVPRAARPAGTAARPCLRITLVARRAARVTVATQRGAAVRRVTLRLPAGRRAVCVPFPAAPSTGVRVDLAAPPALGMSARVRITP